MATAFLRLSARAPAIIRLMALLSIALWTMIFLLNRLGPLNADEIYFAHVLWLMRHGERQYIDFYSNHLPTYFHLWLPFIQGRAETDLSFLLAVKPLGLVLAAIYAWELHRRSVSLVVFGPILLLFLIYARMLDLRPDTVGLLLFNLGVSTMLAPYDRRRLVLGAFVASLSLLFSARAAVMIGFLALALGAVVWRRRDYRTLGALACIAAAEATLLLLCWLWAPDVVGRILQSVFLDPLGMMPAVSLRDRLLRPETFALVLPVAIACAIAFFLLCRQQSHPALIIGLVCASQLALIVLDPSPFGYVYGWATIPTIVGLSLGVRRINWLQVPVILYGLGLAALLIGGGTAYLLLKQKNPPAFSSLRLVPDAPWRSADLKRLSTKRLVELLISGDGQHNFRNQLALRSELCRRVSGAVMAYYPRHPICMRDATYEWAGLTWPNLQADRWRTQDQAFVDVLRRNPPQLIIWSDHFPAPRLGLAARRAMRRFHVGDGYAWLTKDSSPGGGNRGAQFARNETLP